MKFPSDSFNHYLNEGIALGFFILTKPPDEGRPVLCLTPEGLQYYRENQGAHDDPMWRFVAAHILAMLEQHSAEGPGH